MARLEDGPPTRPLTIDRRDDDDDPPLSFLEWTALLIIIAIVVLVLALLVMLVKLIWTVGFSVNLLVGIVLMIVSGIAGLMWLLREY